MGPPTWVGGETCQDAGRSPRSRPASMGPPTWVGGESRQASTPRTAPRGFNGAADLGRRRGERRRARWRHDGVLQWGRRPGSAERQPTTHARTDHELASMGPPTWVGGETLCTSSTIVVQTELQWGRRPGSAESSATTTWRCRRCRFNGAADLGRRRAIQSHHVVAHVIQASMGPPTWVGGESATGVSSSR